MIPKYDKIGVGYNKTRKPDAHLVNRMLFHLQPEADGVYLDIGCGTGNYTNEFQKKGYHFMGIDPSERMLKEARSKNASIDYRIGTAEKTGLKSSSIDGIVASLTVHHWNHLKKAFLELNRVLKPNGNLVIFTSTPEQMKGYWLNHYFPKMLEDSMVQMPTLELVKEYLVKSGFQIKNKESYFIKPDLEDKFLYCGKESPELYFDENIRHGISSFSDLSNKVEVEYGLTNLRRDIDSSNIKKVMKSYQNNLGDYLYLVANKQ
ncbi:class I SAM-dependent methyltransferase [Seonamhaeicola maritimus]|uniref:Class I SAM-dependent methyltransferase n=1 Tax=Seonamhaeicola maritimus TaxID=2591822 RepID=A0A5C7GIH4_9FLAO|nr:class I SAM-dependent methyltransferase [Seonamhaeicola maritimus]TXG37229.1 class I SAM-dependent methyltransferase [Seonamhaeicola maritimus]